MKVTQTLDLILPARDTRCRDKLPRKSAATAPPEGQFLKSLLSTRIHKDWETLLAPR